jgi:hypothetical protein
MNNSAQLYLLKSDTCWIFMYIKIGPWHVCHT